ncbi:MAG: endonuclease [Candidatus Eisenbacteria bacterium]
MRASAVLLIAVAVLAAGFAPAQAQTAVLISEMCDPQLNYLTDRFIEIYNAGGAAVDLTDWTLVAVGNSGDVFSWPLAGSIDPGEALVAGDATTVIAFPVNFPEEAWSSNNSLWNGKIGDGAKLLNAGSVIVDYAVVTGTHFENQDYVRNYGVVLPNTSYDSLEWTATSISYPTDGTPGTHETAQPTPGPTIANIVTSPAAPLPGETVDVYADVSDTTTITSVALFWGTSPLSISNEIAMSLDVGITYVTESTIPAQSAGTTIYFKIQATNDLPGTSVSDTESYSLPYTVSISDVQGAASSSPYNGYAVITHGVVTGRYNSYFTLQDGTGAWNGVWARSLVAPSVGDSVTIRGTVTESDGANSGNTFIVSAVVQSSDPAVTVPEPTVVTSLYLSSEGYEGVLVTVEGALCTNTTLGSGEWEVDDGSGAGRVDDLGYAFAPTLGTSYDITGPLAYRDGDFKLEPRDAGDVVWSGDGAAPELLQVYALDETSVVVTFSEDVEETSAGTPANYAIAGLTVSAAARDASNHDQVVLTVSTMSPVEYTLVVDGVEDLYANAMDNVIYSFDYVDIAPPPGYYDSAEGLLGETLQAALHAIIDNHIVQTYTYSWTAFRSTDDKPNGKVWDIYSDVPGGVPPYEYTFGVDEGGVGGIEGTGYNREHSWPSSWYGGEISPMYSDLFLLYPTDNYVNGQRGSDPYGEVDSPFWTSLNGSKKGNCTYPGYSGLAFEPIDAYKGDLARTYFYVTSRYYSEDAAWPGSAMTDGAEILPWAVNLLLEWHVDDPVSRKELERNGTIYTMQGNRNPFIDRPEFAAAMYVTTGVGEMDEPAFRLHQNAPNPFNPTTTMSFSLSVEADVELSIHDVSGRRVATLASGSFPAGRHAVVWDGRVEGATLVASGVYFCRLLAGDEAMTVKMILLK